MSSFVCFFLFYPYIGKKQKEECINLLVDAIEQKMTQSELLCDKTIVAVQNGGNWRSVSGG